MTDVDFKARAKAARQLLDERRLDEALAEALALLAGYPEKPQSVMLAAEVRKARGEDDEALLVLTEGLGKHSGNLKLLSLARTIAFERGQHEDAAEYGRAIARSNPGDYRNQVFFTQLHLRTGQADAALRQARALIQQFPDLGLPVILASHALVASDVPDRALALLRDAIDRFSRDAMFLTSARHLALRHGGYQEAKFYADRLACLAPKDQNNAIFLTKFEFASRRFAAAIERADRLRQEFPDSPEGPVLKAQALAAQHAVPEAIQTLTEALAVRKDDPELLAVARTITFQNGRFDDAIGYAQKLRSLHLSNAKNDESLAQSLMASGRTDDVEEYLSSHCNSSNSGLRKARTHFEEFKRLRADYPVFIQAWQDAIGNKSGDFTTASFTSRNTPMIQYWSQDEMPDDVRTVSDVWRDLMSRENLGDLIVFNRQTAKTWIDAHAPEFMELFANCFHFAMESDVFRVAYASKCPCIYMDIDSWPLEHTASILRYAVQTSRTMLYLRVYRPWVANGFFVSRPDSPFIKELVRQCLELDLKVMPKNHDTIERTFGPRRYNKVILDLIDAANTKTAQCVTGAFGCSSLHLDETEILLSHEAAVASVRPPFSLGYKITEDYWKGLSLLT